MSDESKKDLDTVVGHFKKKNVHMVVSHHPSDPHSWELEEIENKSDVHGAGSEALQHLSMVADKHKKHVWLLPAGRKGQQKNLTDYYGRHGFQKVRDPISGIGLMHRPPGAKMNLGEEGIPTNSMGQSSSTAGTGAIDTYDPLLDLGGAKAKSKMRKKLFDIMRRKLLEK